ncbi:hypothetical protein [Rhodopirellula bahusiensis]|uniref:8-oxoguanine DNA glycosylase n=3 Tax=Rhodopirellula bahusiensis TaxID=2014065 RepID=UPI003D65132E
MTALIDRPAEETQKCEFGQAEFDSIWWGSPDIAFTPAFWAEVTRLSCDDAFENHRLTDSLASECVMCLLGGHGIPAEHGIAAFQALSEANLLNASEPPSLEEISSVLEEPIQLPSGRSIKYRFAKQKSRYITNFLHSFEEPLDLDQWENVAIRDWLVGFDGIGLKTASWIVRNWFEADDVAILDIHVIRAGVLAGFFEPEYSLPRDYRKMEQNYLSFAETIGVRPSLLDAVIWDQMRRAGGLAIRLFQSHL